MNLSTSLVGLKTNRYFIFHVVAQVSKNGHIFDEYDGYDEYEGAPAVALLQFSLASGRFTATP
jgi:hypothetical protein